MKKVLFYFFLIFQLIPIGSAFASDHLGKVSRLHVRDEDGLIWVILEGERTANRPNCATNVYFVIKNENSPAGKRQLAMLMMAQASNKLVFIEGANTCNRWGDGEDISIVSIRKN